MIARFALASMLLLAACKPPATDDYIERVDLADAEGFASEPLPSPDTEGAQWASSATEGRIIYGQSGEPPVMALQCVEDEGGPAIRLTRIAPADPGAKAFVALIGNAHVARLPVDAVREGDRWQWVGTWPADDEALEVLTGTREVEATIPGAGSIILNPSERPARLIAECRGLSEPEEALPEDGEPAQP